MALEMSKISSCGKPCGKGHICMTECRARRDDLATDERGEKGKRKAACPWQTAENTKFKPFFKKFLDKKRAQWYNELLICR
jgi:hypothetical protein